eukprot:TRINITY_DN263_c0_g1_i1.p1 TRINITY_DN263_c0_g1~~TRINITY_DN263_c0_g1_i1.p1  ORF type:complete len:170 (-),score=60.80 TRINITY_DN263_c0_g1_i1:307-816(-)
MGSPADDFASTIEPYCVAGGIFDFSGTQDNHAYTWVNKASPPEKGEASAVTKDEVANWVKMWWDGSSTEWSSKEEFSNMLKAKDNEPGYQLHVAGVQYRPMRRNPFGEGDSQHVILARGTNKDFKTGLVLAHSDYTVCVAVYDEEENQKEGGLMQAMSMLMQAYKSSGF